MLVGSRFLRPSRHRQRYVTESGAFPPPPPKKPFPFGTVVLVLAGSKVVYDLMCLKEDWHTLSDNEIETGLWNKHVAPSYQYMLHQNVFGEVLGAGAREVGPISQTSTKSYQTFQEGMLFSIAGRKELRIPLSGPNGSGDFVFVAERQNRQWRKVHAFLETPNACYLENGEQITKE